jgi:hypothetical protein
MTKKHLLFILTVTFITGVAVLVFFLSPSEPDSRQIWIYSYMRFGLIIAMLVFVVLVGLLISNTALGKPPASLLLPRLDAKLSSGKTLFNLQTGLAVLALLMAELFLLTFIGLPNTLRPLPILIFVVCIATWIVLRSAYGWRFREHGSLLTRRKTSWRGALPVQRRTFRILFFIGLLYFLAFIPLNISKGNEYKGGNFSGIDEVVEYPAIIRSLTPVEDFGTTVYRVLIDESIVYGHSFISISAVSLTIPRLIFGTGFGEKEVLNLLLLRQLINVLPVVLSLYLLTWIITRFKSTWQAVALFIFLLLIPGVVTFNIRFYHPDGLLLFFIILTFFFLQRDELRLGNNFYLAAFACGMAAAIKLWGFFFFLAIALYLVIALVKKYADFGKMVRSGVGFIVVMVMTIFISTPGLMIPSVAKFTINTLASEQTARIEGNQSPDPEGVYEKGLTNWMKYFQMYYIREYYFYFCFTSLLITAFIGSRKQLTGLLLAWCLVTAIYLVYFVAIKSYWYMLPLMVPLYAAPFLLPGALEDSKNDKIKKVFSRPWARTLTWVVVGGLCLSQFAFNLVQVSYMIW